MSRMDGKKTHTPRPSEHPPVRGEKLCLFKEKSGKTVFVVVVLVYLYAAQVLQITVILYFCIFSLWNNNSIHVVECRYGLNVKCKCIYLSLPITILNIVCVLDYYKPLYKGRCTIITVYVSNAGMLGDSVRARRQMTL